MLQGVFVCRWASSAADAAEQAEDRLEERGDEAEDSVHFSFLLSESWECSRGDRAQVSAPLTLGTGISEYKS
ncbi:ATP synthase gamma chain [Microbacterium sp. HM58-2]|nr:ATP synthase gamma chain [Microbacterium sp. HM58-2]